MDPLYTCVLCDKKAWPDFISFDELKGWCTHNIQRGEKGSYVSLLVCPQCSHMTSDQAMSKWLIRMREGEIGGYQ